MRNNASVIMHGEAVALGMVLALLLSQKVAGFPPLIASDLIGLLKKSMILPRRADFAQMLAIGEFEVNDQWPTIAAMMLNDKKNQNLENDGVDWVLLKDLGEVNHAESTYLTRYSVNGLQVLWSELLSMI
jgi:3-dehydroquinate synthetase